MVFLAAMLAQRSVALQGSQPTQAQPTQPAAMVPTPNFPQQQQQLRPASFGGNTANLPYGGAGSTSSGVSPSVGSVSSGPYFSIKTLHPYPKQMDHQGSCAQQKQYPPHGTKEVVKAG
ncbi:hypothetical protein BASA81_017401, partial [Batrachochytrium salamandrivorans]